ncbi:MAG: flagellar type III secretion system pore protein FliP [Anaerotruncus sp.]|nr:flagellar type III secretion system pore protein FliP [Anaerotruncus sp.]
MEKVQEKKRILKRQLKRFLVSAVVTGVLLVVCFALHVSAAPAITLDLGSGEAGGSYGLLDMLFTVTLLALAPSILMMMTSFTRIIIVLSFLRNALGTQQSPPNQVLIGLALFLTMFVMSPVFMQINEVAYQPYRAGELTQIEAVEAGIRPLKEFMIKQVYTDDINLFLTIANNNRPVEEAITLPEDLTELGLEIVVPSFITSELKRGFLIGFLLFIPFLIIDMVVSSTLMSMGMVMLPPSTIALPFKIMTFVLVDGWGLLLGNLASGFHY